MADRSTSENPERLQILEMIESGRISPQEGLLLLQALSEETHRAAEPRAGSPPTPTTTNSDVENPLPIDASEPLGDPKAGRWRRWWLIPLWVGVGITLTGAALMYLALRSSGGLGFWFLCAWIPFLLGVAVIALAWYSRTARWIHIRVQRTSGERPGRIALSLPLPIRPSAWFVRTFGHRLRGLEKSGLDELILALGENTTPEAPVYIEVDDDEQGERVEVYIG